MATLQVKEYTLTSKLSLPVCWILHTFSGTKFSISMVPISYFFSDNLIGVNNNNKVPVYSWQPRGFADWHIDDNHKNKSNYNILN